MSDSSLIQAFNSSMNKAIFVFEDIDSALISNKRRNETCENRVTLSGLLNCIDGIATREGNILFFTSNHVRGDIPTSAPSKTNQQALLQPEKLSPALLRPGRIDKKFYFGLASKEQASLLFRRFFPDSSTERSQAFVDSIPADTFSIAEVGNLPFPLPTCMAANLKGHQLDSVARSVRGMPRRR
jgi:chaperone BCS1